MLFAEEQIASDGVGVVGVEQLAAVGLDRGGFLIELIQSPRTCGLLPTQSGERDALNSVPLLRRQGDGPVAVRDALLYLCHGERFALRAGVVAAVTQEVHVEGAVSAARVLQDQPSAASDAEDGALQVVVMLAGPLAVVPSMEEVLDRRPGDRID